MTPFFAALSIAEKALLKDSPVSKFRKASMAVFALVFVALLYAAFFLSERNFFIADFVMGMR